MGRGLLETVGELLLEIKHHPESSLQLHLAKTNLNYSKLKSIEKHGFFIRIKDRSGKKIRFLLTERGHTFLIHYGKLLKILMSDS